MPNAWPAIQAPSFPLGVELNYPQVRTPFENGAVQSRSVWSRARRTFSLSWSAMTAANLATLEAFFIANQGLTITWTHPSTAVAYTVRFKDDSLKSSLADGTRSTVSVVLEEV